MYINHITNKTPDEIRREYLSTLKNRELEEAYMTTADMLINQGMQQGILEGKREGMREGTLKGKREGMREGTLKGKREGMREGIYQTVKGFKSAGVSMDLIVKATGLSEEEIKQI
ncbi:MAG: hypothetical protein B0D92_08655 [Spirochaeta sp. LUC14_002_19_P3]|nr:MAG: hypothetical protein B0D92_08655 [Spirochaeta sp. LUC14_002_19_P3]